MFIKRLFLLSFLIYIYGAAQEVTVSGFMYDAADGSPLEGTEVVFVHTGDHSEIRTYSDNQGQFSVSIPPGHYAFNAYTYGYLIPPRQFCDIDSSIENFDIGFTTADYILNRNFIEAELPADSVVTEHIVIENTGSGSLFFSAAVAKTQDELLVLSKKTVIQHRRPSLPALKINGVRPNSGKIESALAPEDTLWELVYRDPEDSPVGLVDIHEIFMQIKDNMLYVRTTFHRPITLSYRDFLYGLLIDTDGDRNTGESSGWGWIGPEFSLAVSDFGYGPMTVLSRCIDDEWIYVCNADYSRFQNNGFVCGINLNRLGTQKMLSFFAIAEHELAPAHDDMAPDENTGCFLYATGQETGVKLTPLYNTLGASGKDSLTLTINSALFDEGVNQRFLLITSNDPAKSFNVIPLAMTIRSNDPATGSETGNGCLLQNYPNPCNPATTIPYTISSPGFVTLKVVNILGEEMETLVQNFHQPGSYTARFDGSRYTNGIYMVQLQMGDFQQNRKFILLK